MKDERVEIIAAKSVEERSYDALFERMQLDGFANGLKPWGQLTPLERATWRARCAATRVLIDEAIRSSRRTER